MKGDYVEVRVVEGELTKIHPALDFANGLAIVAVPLQTEINENGSKETSFKYWLITSKREKFLLSNEELLSRGLFKSSNCYLKEGRWSYSSIEKWLRGEDYPSHPRKIFRIIKRKYEQYLDYPDPRMYSYMALWVMGTYFFPLFDAYPIPLLNGPSGSGKSKTIDVTERVAFNAINTANISDASIYRVVECSRGTILLDELEKAANTKEEGILLGLLRAGFKKGAKVIRSDKGKDQRIMPRHYEVYSPKMIANIYGINEEALKNRCILFNMSPSRGDKANNYPREEDSVWQRIRDELYKFTLGCYEDVKEAKGRMQRKDFGLRGYYFLMWQPIFALAYLIDDVLLEEMVGLAKEKTEDRIAEVDELFDRKLLSTIKEMYEDGRFALRKFEDRQFISSQSIYSTFMERLGYEETNRPNWFVPRFVGKLVSSLNIGKGKQENINGKPTRGYWIHKGKLLNILQRYGIA